MLRSFPQLILKSMFTASKKESECSPRPRFLILAILSNTNPPIGIAAFNGETKAQSAILAYISPNCLVALETPAPKVSLFT